MENNTQKVVGIIPFIGVCISAILLACSTLILISITKDLKKTNVEQNEKIEKLQQNQKSSTELYNESNKPCAGC